MSQLVKLATCNLNQWALDFDGNLARVKESIRQAKRAQCRFRLGPELEIPGYGCEDHFLELDTIWHSWDCLCELLTELDEDAGDGKKELLTANILCDIGMPVLHRDVIYNCRVYVLDGKILGNPTDLILLRTSAYKKLVEVDTAKLKTPFLAVGRDVDDGRFNIEDIVFVMKRTKQILQFESEGIRPKMYLANDGNYRETRWFTEWHGDLQAVETYYLPPRVLKKLPTTHPRTVPIGIFVLRCNGCVLGAETCEELFTPNSPHITMSLDGVHIITNGSGSHHQLRKLKQRVDLIRSATEKSGGIYLYANQLGCDGGRCFYDGCAMIWENGNLVAQGSQFGLKEVEVQTGVVDVNEVRSFRASFKSRSVQASLNKHKYPRVDVDFDLGCTTTPPQKKSPFREVFLHTPMEEIAFGPSAWLWDYLIRRGYFLPLSGGMDSSSTALLVGIMAQRVYEEVRTGRNPTVLRDLREIVKNANFLPSSGQDVCRQLFFTCYMASQYSGAETRRRAQEVSELIGANHCSICIDKVTDAVQEVFADMTMEVAQNENDSASSKAKAKPLRVKKPDINSSGVENIALQNIQARSRMVMSYFLAQLLPWQVQADGDAAKKVWPGQLLVLGSANVDEALRGYYTKYDCSAADINPIGGIKKVDLKAFLLWGHENYGAARNSSVLRDTAVAEPSAELTGSEGDQKDEVDMGMSYREL
eukprot:g17955.t1